ncbi:uncharacterized protein LOC130894170 [Diorhabda carinulata]|uniref:uncharacterized protein LOC130894170 n=1 Tax=Diorhabda carinulata TaxID=1163345 RepID=UPI0025A2A386|nr:uncharacterized protein LOC130894170 [Diorhabda carinulata]
MLEQFTDKTQLHNKTNKYQKHIAYSAGYYVKCSYNEDLSFFKSYRGRDCMDWFANELSNLAESIKSEIKTITPMEEKPDLPKKGVFCYDFIDSWEKLNTCELPPIEAFYNKLEDKNISIEKYSHAHAVWKSFDIENLGQYSDLYLKTDVLLLSDVFKQFRRKCSITYGLDPAWYYTMPGYTWDCMLKYVGCKLELLHDVDMIMFIEKAIRGGISVCSSRLSNANNKYMPKYDSTKPSKYLLYLDVNNLYGWAMCKPLPYGGFEWLDNENFDVMSVADNSSVGYILQVDLEYPHELHDLHRDFPFAPEHRKPVGSNYSKLMTTLYCKKEYTVHYRNLKQMLANGLKIKKIHKILKFNQSAWLRPYIELNTRLRAAATNDFEKNLYKLANNAVFGKTMENIRKHRIVKLVKTWNGRYGAKNLISSVRFHSRTVFNENLIAVELTKSELVFNKPLYVGMTVLDLSKLCMYQFHYDYMIPKMGIDRCKLMYMDTDSFVYELICDDAYEEVLKADLTKFDTSDYPINNNYNIPQFPIYLYVIAVKTIFMKCISLVVASNVTSLRQTSRRYVKRHVVKSNVKCCVKRPSNVSTYENVLFRNMSSEEYRRRIEEFINSIGELKKDIAFYGDKSEVMKQMQNLSLFDKKVTWSSLHWVPEEVHQLARRLPQTTYPLRRIQPTPCSTEQKGI